jgi:hypothetical protein
MSSRFRVSGVVCEAESHRPILDLVVRAYDRDALSDDFLGEARTDADGRFAIVFTQRSFRDWAEAQPDLYVEVFDASGRRRLFTTRDATRRNAGPEERFAIAISRDQL